jgi:hypothetical protein
MAEPLVSPRRARYLWICFGIAALATVFDAFSSWQIIEVNPIAAEGNPMLSSLSELVGFGGAMALRGIWGVALLLVLLPIALRHMDARGRRLAGFGIYLTSTVLFSLALYHLWFRATYG